MLITDPKKRGSVMQRMQEKAEFNARCRACSDEELISIIEQERAAGHQDYVITAKQEKIARGIA